MELKNLLWGGILGECLLQPNVEQPADFSAGTSKNWRKMQGSEQLLSIS
jgi:hypothetical protein